MSWSTYISQIISCACMQKDEDHMFTYVQLVEMIQRKAAKFIFSNHSRFTSACNWQPLKKKEN